MIPKSKCDEVVWLLNSFSYRKQQAEPDQLGLPNCKPSSGVVQKKNDDKERQRKQSPSGFEECLETYKKMFMFDWDLKDIFGSRSSPSKYSTFKNQSSSFSSNHRLNLTKINLFSCRR